MALDRQSIEKKDFPIARRGYDPEAVDAHLERLAAEVDGLQREVAAGGRSSTSATATVRSSPASLAIAASEQVRTIVEAAETSAAGIEAGAHEEADRIRREADAAARATREDAVARATDHVGAVGDATSLMLQRVDAMESEIGALVESLRTGATRLGADLSLLQGNMGELYDVAGASSDGGGTPTPPPPIESLPLPPRLVPAPAPVSEPSAVEPDPAPRSLRPIPEAPPDPSPHVEAPVVPPGLFATTEFAPNAEGGSKAGSEEPAGGEADVDGARLIALNMALNGASREEIGAYLRNNFDLPNYEAFVVEAFAAVEG